ncbi:MAG: histidine phosphatase family protein [Gammaproteobacteria bacterium]|nr:histidine phosphatase family protein [Gammaproteobacteria bacterium]
MTQKTLIIMRHGKSDWSSQADQDFDRPLNSRGRKDAPVMADWLRKQSTYAGCLCQLTGHDGQWTRRNWSVKRWKCDPGNIVYDDGDLRGRHDEELLNAIGRHAGDCRHV